MSKYYTPEIEEFHIGFEFDLKRNEEQNWGLRHKYGYTSPRLEKILGYIHEGGVRVKHLDQEDIESFGIGDWTDSRGYWRGFKTKNDNQYYVFHHNVDRIQSWCVVEIVDVDTEKRRVLFTGTIKNKSEMKKILDMIGWLH